MVAGAQLNWNVSIGQGPIAIQRSRWLRVLAESTMTYVAASNYGEPARQILKIFREELRESEPLRKWWGSGEVATAGPKVEAFLQKFSELEEYLGNETVLAGTLE